MPAMVSRTRSWVVAVVAILVMTVSYVDRSAFSVLAPSVTKDLGISETAYGWLSAAFSMSYLVATPLAGLWIGRLGPRRGLPAALLVWSAVAAVHGLAPGFTVLLVLRILLGVAEAPSFPGTVATLTKVLPPGDRERGVGGAFSGSSLGAMIAPPLATFLFQIGGGWRVAFLGTALVGLVWIPLWLAVTAGGELPQRLGPLVDKGGAARGGSVRAALADPAVLRAFVVVLSFGPITNVFLFWGAKYLVRTFALTQVDVGHYLWLPPLCLDVGAILAGDLLARGVRPRLVLGAATVAGLGVAALPLCASPWQGVTIIGLGCFVGGVGYATSTNDVLRRVGPERGAMAVGLQASAQSLSLILANPIVGRVVDHTHSFGPVGVGLALWLLPGALAWLLWEPRNRPVSSTSS